LLRDNVSATSASHAHVVHRQQFHHELGLFQNAECLGLDLAHQTGDAQGLLLAQRDVRHAFDAQLGGAAVTPKTVQQQTPLRRINTGKRFLDATLGDRRQQARFGSAVPQAETLITQVQAASLHRFTHRQALRAGVG
jgi:hypothetical protein